jgi:5-formyltetrahydrofolate cyclo-ligase
MSHLKEKSVIRKEMLALRKSLPAAGRRNADTAINGSLQALPQFKAAPLVAAYVSDGTEPDLSPCLEAVLKSGRRVCLPKSKGDDYVFAEVGDLADGLKEGLYGLKEPGDKSPEVPADDLKSALWLVPGVAFDEGGGRLGRGKGVYDRLLVGGCGFSIGVFYEFQRCESLPMERHDFVLDMIVTERQVRDLSLKKEGKEA